MEDTYNLLYVEDDVGSRKVMLGLIQALPYSVGLTIFNDSKNFLPRVKSITPQPDVILLDIHVQPHNGFEMLQMLRFDTFYASKKIVALTASVMNEEVKRFKEAGFDGVLAKPLKFHEFPDHMKRILATERQWMVIR